MTKKGTTRIERGQAITFRLPSDTPDHLLKQLQKLKETERRNFSSEIAKYALEGVSNSLSKERETVTIPLPRQLSKEQRNWLKHSHSEALLGSVVYQLLVDPVRATSFLASLNSNAIDIDEALYLQEEVTDDPAVLDNHHASSSSTYDYEQRSKEPERTSVKNEKEGEIDDLEDFDLNKAREEFASSIEKKHAEKDNEQDDEDLLGDFLAQMNK
ncbi:hypothetical protein CR194_19120 [Salipaludibacillus keqinensis]|uniref:Uncharacterized protein n=1 Tax=Salipaludibacillus keqinensis TaxID=2045207 RepID=A0A323TBG6_9BACI|nr:hypothetical protein [Salipaludibacillus keqinensis]PYZ91734.1 hypothetical protein CR194_19120 [Salipaludibacillus keqinensis]